MPGGIFNAWSLFLIAVWIGLLTGWLELPIVLVREWAWPRASLNLIRTNQYFVWMIPASHLLIFTGLGLVIAVLGSVHRGLGRWLATSLPLAVGLFSLLQNVEGLHVAAAGVLAIGAGLLFEPLLARQGERLIRLVRLSVPGLAVGLIALVGFASYRVQTAEQRALAACPPAKPGAPNVVLIVLDTVRASCLSLYGHYRLTTPNLERLALRGLSFAQARATASWTAPTHGTLMTGRWPHELSVGMRVPLDGKYPTLANVLSHEGYATAGFVGNIYYCNSVFGINRGFAHYEDAYENQTISLFEIVWSTGLGKRIIQALGYPTELGEGEALQRKYADMINRDVLSWVDGRPADRPFFLFVNYYDAHRPYEFKMPRNERFGHAALPRAQRDEIERRYLDLGKLEVLPPDLDQIKRDALDLYHDSYDSCIAYLDNQMGALVSELERRGLMENTLLVVTSDHGEQMGEHGVVTHGATLYSPEVHVPLVIVPPANMPGARAVSRPVSVREIPVTIAACVGLGAHSPFPGRSLMRFLDQNRVRHPELSPVLCELKEAIAFTEDQKVPPPFGPARSIVSPEGVYIRLENGTEELYDLWNDPLEVMNLVQNPDSQPGLGRLRATLEHLCPDLTGGGQ